MKGKPVIPPVHLTATYKFDRSDDLIDVVQNRSGYLYSRWDNPSVVAVEEELAAMEGYDKAIGFGSGMAAISTAIMANIEAASRIVATRELYGGTFELFHDVLSPLKVETVFVNCWKTQEILAEIEKGRKEPVMMVGNLSAERDFTDVRDMVNGYLLAALKGKPGEVYNICVGKAIKIDEVLKMVIGMSKVKVKVEKDPTRMRPSDVPILLGDCSKFKRRTGWKPKIKFGPARCIPKLKWTNRENARSAEWTLSP